MKILIVDDHVLIRDAMGTLVRELVPEADLHYAANATAAHEFISGNADIQLVILDLYLPDESGLVLLQRCRHLKLPVPALVLSASTEQADMIHVLEQGAVGYLPKASSRR